MTDFVTRTVMDKTMWLVTLPKIERREWSSLYVMCDDAAAATLLKALGFNAVHHPAH